MVSLCSARLLGPKLRSELRQYFTSYLGHIVLAFTNALLYVTGIPFLQNHFVSLTLRPGGAYVFRPDTFLVQISRINILSVLDPFVISGNHSFDLKK